MITMIKEIVIPTTITITISTTTRDVTILKFHITIIYPRYNTYCNIKKKKTNEELDKKKSQFCTF